MDKKITLAILGALSFIIFPVKIIIEFMNYSWVRSTIFACIFSACVFLTMIFSLFLCDKKTKEYSIKSMPLALTSAICGLLYLWSFFCYFKNPAPSDAKFRYSLMTVLFVLSSLFFVFVFFAHFQGKNLFKKVQFIIYAPSFAYLVSLMLFFSFETGKPDAYNILAQFLTLMFFVYYSNFYVRCSNKNFKKRCFAFGVPAVAVTLCYSIPNLIRNFDSFNSLNTALQMTYIATSFYIFTFLVSDLKKPNYLNKETSLA